MPKKTTKASTPTQPTKSPSSSVAKPKVKIDPEILAIRAKAREEIKELQKTRNSGAVLVRIIDKDLPRLTNGDREKLIDHLTNEGAEPVKPAASSEEGPTPWPTMEDEPTE